MKEVNVNIDGIIDSWQGYNLADFIASTRKVEDGDTVNIYVDSIGGDVDTGFAIAEQIKSLSKKANVITHAKRVYSIATIIYLAAPTRYASLNSSFMIHNPWTPSAQGDKDELRKYANELEEIENKIEATYTAITGVNSEILSVMMQAETEFYGQTALNLGFATALKDETEKQYAKYKAVAMFNINQKKETEMDENKIVNALRRAFNLDTKSMEDEKDVKAMEEGEEKEEMAMEDDKPKSMLSEEEMEAVIDAVVSRVMEVIAPEMQEIKEESLAMQRKTKETQEAQLKAVEKVVNKLETRYDAETEKFQDSTEKALIGSADPFAVLRKRAQKNK